MDKKEFLELLKEACREHLCLGTRFDGESHIIRILWKNENGSYETLAEEYLP